MPGPLAVRTFVLWSVVACLAAALPGAARAQAAPTPVAMSPAHVRAALLAAPHATASPAPSLAAALDTARRRTPRVDPWFGFDKVQHFTFSFLVTVGGQYALTDKAGIRARGALPASVAAGAAVGLAKEVYDARRRGGSGFSRRDLAWDALGLGAAALFIVL